MARTLKYAVVAKDSALGAMVLTAGSPITLGEVDMGYRLGPVLAEAMCEQLRADGFEAEARALPRTNKPTPAAELLGPGKPDFAP